MLKLKNITINGNLIEADYFPESDTRSAHVSLDTESGAERTEVLDEYGGDYARMAIAGLHRGLKEIQAGKPLKKERTVMWY